MDSDQYRHQAQTNMLLPLTSLQFLYLSHQSFTVSPVKAARVTAGFSPVDPCQVQILIKWLCDRTGDNLCLSPREAKILWKELLHGYSSTLKLSATPLRSEGEIKCTQARMFYMLSRQCEELLVHPNALIGMRILTFKDHCFQIILSY